MVTRAVKIKSQEAIVSCRRIKTKQGRDSEEKKTGSVRSRGQGRPFPRAVNGIRHQKEEEGGHIGFGEEYSRLMEL